jgi:hypothetical protein
VRSESINNCFDSSGQLCNLDQKSKLREKQAHVDILDQRCNKRRRRVCSLVFARYALIAALIANPARFTAHSAV